MADQRLAKGVRPPHLRAAAHDEQHGGGIAASEALVRDVDSRRSDLPSRFVRRLNREWDQPVTGRMSSSSSWRSALLTGPGLPSPMT